MLRCCLLALGTVFLGGVLSGCGGGDGPKGDPTFAITGIVTLDKEPLPTGRITFLESNREPVREYIANIQDGKFEINAPPGKHRVQIVSFPDENPNQSVDEMGSGPAPKQILPARYNINSELTAELTGPEELKFDLESGNK